MENISGNSDQEVHICKVCGDKANHHVYYGGKSCMNCRQFFRRSVVKFSRQEKIHLLNSI